MTDEPIRTDERTEDKPMSDKFVIRKRGRRWVVDVPAGAIAVIPFTAPFPTWERAIRYVAFWAGRTPVTSRDH